MLFRRGRRFPVEPTARWVVAGILFVLVLYPLLELIVQPFEQWSDLWHQAKEIRGLGRILVNTGFLALGSVALATLVAMVLALCQANLSVRAGRFAQLMAIAPMVVPPLAGVTGWAFLLSPKVGYLNIVLRYIPPLDQLSEGPMNVYSMPWIVIITGIYLIPYAFIFVQTGLANIDPRLEIAARSAGSGWWGVQFRIVIPLLRPALVYGAGVVALLALGQFTAPLLLGRTQGIDVVTTVLYRLTTQPPVHYAVATLIALPVLLLSVAGIALQRRALASNVRFVMAGKGLAAGRRSRPWLMLPVILYGLIVVVPPLIGLILVALSPYWSGTIDWSGLSTSAFFDVLNDTPSRRAIFNSLRYALGATVLASLLSLGAAVIVLRGRGWARLIVDYLVNIPLAVPAILFGMGIFLSYGLGAVTQVLLAVFGINLYGSGIIMVVAYVVLVLPHGTRLCMSGLAQLNPQLEDAARVSGSSSAGVLMRVLVPLLRRNIISAAMIMFVLSSHEFAASSLLVGPDSAVASTLLYDEWDTGTYPGVAVIALLMVALAMLGLLVILFFDIASGMQPSALRRAQRGREVSA
jgi:iron(III) transport system permease protein